MTHQASLSATLEALTVFNNGRPAGEPMPMHVGIIAQLSDPYAKPPTVIATVPVPDEPGVYANVNQTLRAPSFPKGGEIFKGQAVPEAVDLTLLYVSYYENDLGPILFNGLVKVVQYVLKDIPIVGSIASDLLLQIKVGKIVAAELARATLHVNPAAYTGEKQFTQDVEFVASKTLSGVYRPNATGRDVRSSATGDFIRAGDPAARASISIAIA